VLPRQPILRALARLCLGGAIVFALMGTLELALVLFDFRNPPRDAPIVVELPEGWVDGRALHDKDVATLWKPSPGAKLPWGLDERVNEEGFRGPALPLERTPGRLRIATLGDSSTFGHSVAWDECYSARVARMLTEAGQPAEVIDAGVIGYSVRQGLERWRQTVRAYRPDVVVAAFGAVIEHGLAMGKPDDELIRAQVLAASSWKQTMNRLRRDLRLAHLAAWVADALRGGREEIRKADRRKELLAESAHSDIGLPDWKGMRRVAVPDFEKFLLQLRDEVRDSGARLIVLSMPRRPRVERERPVVMEYTRVIQEMADRGEFEMVDGRRALGRAVRKGPSTKELMADDFHPSALGHEFLAQALVEVIGTPEPR
jgi:lysophospholipase L1-like esterase